MSTLRLFSIVMITCGLSSVAFAQPPAAAKPATAATPADKAAAKPEEKKICRRLEPAVGEISGERVCKTKPEWDASDKLDQSLRDGALRATDLMRNQPTMQDDVVKRF